MNHDTTKGKLTQLTGDIKKKWGKLTDDDVKMVEGEQDKLIGRIQEEYGHTKEDIAKELRLMMREE